MQYAGSDWVKLSLNRDLSPFGESVADLLGEWVQGIYHLDHKMLSKTNWSDNKYISINYRGDLSTYDNNGLSKLVFLAHWLCIRVEINPCNFKYIKISFSPRERGNDIYKNHPKLDESVDHFKNIMEREDIIEKENL
jgi:hypothetical protein